MIQWAKKTGDYSVLSHADMCVIALTHMLDEEYKKERKEQEKGNGEKASSLCLCRHVQDIN